MPTVFLMNTHINNTVEQNVANDIKQHKSVDMNMFQILMSQKKGKQEMISRWLSDEISISTKAFKLIRSKVRLCFTSHSLVK